MNTLELLEIEDRASVDRPRTMGEYVPRLVPGQRLRDDVKPLEITQPDGVSFTPRRQPAALAEVVDAARLQPTRGPGDPHASATRTATGLRPVAHRLSFAEMVVPYRDPTNDHKARTAFDIGEWGLGFMTTSLELGCDCLGEIAYLDAVVHDATASRARSATRSASTRRTTRSSGSTSTPPPAHGGAARAPPGGLLPRHRRQLRVPRLLALLPGRQHRVRGARHRDHGHEPLPRGRAAALRHARRPSAPTRPSTSTSSSPGSTSTWTARPTRSHDRVEALPMVPTTRTAWPSSSAARRCAPRRRASRTTTGDPAGLEGRQRGGTTFSLGTPVAYKLVPGGVLPGDARPVLWPCSGGRR